MSEQHEPQSSEDMLAEVRAWLTEPKDEETPSEETPEGPLGEVSEDVPQDVLEEAPEERSKPARDPEPDAPVAAEDAGEAPSREAAPTPERPYDLLGEHPPGTYSSPEPDAMPAFDFEPTSQPPRFGRKRRARWQAYEEAARRLGFETTRRFGSQTLEGLRHGIAVRVSYSSGGENSPSRTAYSLEYDSLDLGLDIRKRSALSSLAAATWASSRYVLTGDPSFDGKFDVRGDTPDTVRTFLTEERRQAAFNVLSLATVKNRQGFRITDTGMTVWGAANPAGREIAQVVERLLDATTTFTA
jgi:hypothetical protein